MSKKARIALAILMGFFMLVGIIMSVITHDEKVYMPFALVSLILAGIVKFAGVKEKYDNKIINEKNCMTSRKARVYLIILFVVFIIMGYITNFNSIAVLVICGMIYIFAIIFFVLRIKEQKNIFKTIILNMGCTEKVSSVYETIISDQEMIFTIEKFIVMERADINLKMRDKDGKTMLIYAALYGRANVVKYLLDKRADINMKDYDFFSALHAGVMSNDVETVKVLLKAGAEVNAKDSMGNSPIMLGDYTTDLEVFKLLMEYGANSEQKNNYGVSAKDRFSGSVEILEILSQR